MNVLTTHWSDLNKTLVEHPEMPGIWLRGLQNFDDLDGESKLRFGAHLGRFLRFADSLYLGVLDGTLDGRLWRGYERTIADTVAYPGFQTWWATRKHWQTDEFCALIDRHIQTAKPKIYDGYDSNPVCPRRSADLCYFLGAIVISVACGCPATLS